MFSPPQLTALKLLGSLNMALSVYDAVIGSYEQGEAFAGYPWKTWTSLREAWAVAEHHGMAQKDKLKVYAALLVDIEASDVGNGHLALGGKTAPHHLKITDGKPEDLPTLIWGNYGWSTWCHTMEDAIKEAIASNSRGPIEEVAEQKPSINWLIMELDISLNKLPYLLKMGYVTTGKERNDITSFRLHGDVPGTWISSVHMAEQWGMSHQTWADIKLGDWHMKTNVFCQECGCKGTTWAAHCAACWAKLMTRKRPRVPRGASSGEQPAPQAP